MAVVFGICPKTSAGSAWQMTPGTDNGSISECGGTSVLCRPPDANQTSVPLVRGNIGREDARLIRFAESIFIADAVADNLNCVA